MPPAKLVVKIKTRRGAGLMSSLPATARLLSVAVIAASSSGFRKLTDVESETKNKFYVYAKDAYGFARRFLLIRKGGRWLVDKQQDMDGGWKNCGL